MLGISVAILGTQRTVANAVTIYEIAVEMRGKL